MESEGSCNLNSKVILPLALQVTLSKLWYPDFYRNNHENKLDTGQEIKRSKLEKLQ